MDGKDLKKIVAGLSIAGLLAGSTMAVTGCAAGTSCSGTKKESGATSCSGTKTSCSGTKTSCSGGTGK